MKRFLSIILVLCMMLGVVGNITGCANAGKVVLSRGEWIELLASEFGLDDSTLTEPSFTDVPKDNTLYNSIQSCVDWGVLNTEESSTFNPDEDAVVDFALSTALAAADIDLGDASAEEYARENDIIGKSYLDIRGNLTNKKADEIIAWAKDLYLNQEHEPVEKVELSEKVEDLTQTTQIVSSSNQNYTLSGSGIKDVAVGDIIILPKSEEYPYGYARKVTEVTKNGGTISIQTEDPALEELCAELEIDTVVVPKKEDVQLQEGVTWTDAATGMAYNDALPEISNLTEPSHDSPVIEDTAKGIDLNFNINFTKGGKLKFSQNWADLFQSEYSGGKVGVSKDFNSLFGLGEKVTIGGEKGFTAESGIPSTAGELFNKTSTIPDKTLFGKDPYDNTKAIEAYKAGNMTLDELKKELDLTKDQHEKEVACMTNKFKGSYEITGSLSIKDLYVEPEIKLKKVLGIPTGIDKMSVEVNFNCVSTLSVKGKFSEELTVATCPVPVGPSGVTINVKLILFADLNGELSVRAEVANNTKMEYSGGKTKKTSNNSSSVSADFSAVLDVGPGFKVDLLVWGIRVLDTKLTCAVRLKVGASLKLGTTYSNDEEEITINRKTTFEFSGKGYVPIVKLSIGQGDSLASKLKLSFSWEIIGEKKAYQFDLFSMDVVIWEETQVIKLREEKKEENEEDEDLRFVTDYLKLDEYYKTIAVGDSGTITIANLPEGYTAADLIWSSDDPSKVTVSNGVLTAKDYGATIISVKTKDDMFTCYCSVIITSTPVDFTPLEDVKLS